MVSNDSDNQMIYFTQHILSAFSVIYFYALTRWLMLPPLEHSFVKFQYIFLCQPLLIFSFLILLSISNHLLTDKPIDMATKKIFSFTPLIISGLTFDVLERYLSILQNYKGVFYGIDEGLLFTLIIGYFIFTRFALKKSLSPYRIIFGLFIYPIGALFIFGLSICLRDYFFPIASNLFSALITLILGGFWYFYYNKPAFISLMNNLRLLRIVHYCFMLTFGAAIYFYTTHASMHITFGSAVKLVTGYLAVIFAWLTVVNVNDKYDLVADKVLQLGRPLVTGIIPQNHFEIVTKVYILSSLYFAALINPSFLFITLIMIGIAYSYSAPPFRFKKYPFIATFILATVNLMITFLGFLVFSPVESLADYPFQIMLMIWLIFTLSNNSKDIRDYEGDKADGVITLPTLLGLRWSKIIIGLLMLLSYFLAPFLLEINALYPFALIFGLITFWLINQKKVEDLPFYLCYFVYFIIILFHMFVRIP